MRATAWALVVLLGAAAARGQEPAAVRQTGTADLMMWHLSPVAGATPELAATLEGLLRRHLEQAAGSKLLDAMTMDSLLLVEGNEKYLRCGVGPACLAGLGRSAGMKRVIAGEIGKEGGTVFYHLVLVEVASGRVLSRARLTGGLKPAERLLEEIGVAMLQPQRYRGRLLVIGAPAGAELYLDGHLLGRAPLEQPVEAGAGEHRLEVRHPDYLKYEATVRVPYDATATARVEAVALAPAEQPFWADWPFWTAAGAGVALLATGGGLYYDATVLQANADQCRADGVISCAESYQDRADKREIQAFVMFGLGGAGLAAAGVIAIIDVAAGGGAETGPRARSQVTLLPQPGGGLVQLLWRF